MYPEVGDSWDNVVLVGHLKVLGFSPPLLGVVKIISSHDNQSSTHGVNGLKDLMGDRIVYISMERVYSPASGAWNWCCQSILRVKSS